MFVALSRFEVRNGMQDSVRDAFVSRPHMVEDAAGFVRLDVLCPADKPEEFWLLTYWQDEPAYREWHGSHLRKDAHHGIPAGLRLVPGATQMTYLNHITD